MTALPRILRAGAILALGSLALGALGLLPGAATAGVVLLLATPWLVVAWIGLRPGRKGRRVERLLAGCVLLLGALSLLFALGTG